MSGIVGIVLGAGASRRLGRPKQTLPLGPRTLLAHTVGEVERSTLDRVVVVVPGDGDERESGSAQPLGLAAEVRAAFTPERAEVVGNPESATGCASSLQTGLDVASDADAIVMVLGDMPGVTTAVIDEVVQQWHRQPGWAAVTSYRDRLGHPLVFSAAAFAELRGLHGDKAVWKIVDREPPERVRRLAIDAACPLDVDTWDDYRAVCAAFGVEATDPPPHAASD